MNKYIFAAIIIVCISLKLVGQESIRINEIGNRWNYAKNYINIGPNGFNYWKNYSYQVADSIKIGGLYYNKIMSYSDTTYVNGSVKYYIRQSGNEVFFSDSTQEIKAFDFSLEKGDSTIVQTTFETTVEEHMPGSVLIVADSVKFEGYHNGSKLKTLYVRVHPSMGDFFDPDFFINDIWIEGIGSIWIGLDHLNWYQNMLITGGDENASYLLCFHTKENLVYQNPDYNTCYIKTSAEIIHEGGKNLVGIASKEGRELTINTTEKGRLTVSTLDGRLIFKKRIDQPETIVHLTQSGIYLYRFTTQKGEVQTGKVVVK